MDKKLKEEPAQPMALMRKRERMIDTEYPLPYRKPLVTLGTTERVAKAIADWDKSDPFAYGRAALYIRQGYIDPKEVEKEVHLRTKARRDAKIKEVEHEQA